MPNPGSRSRDGGQAANYQQLYLVVEDSEWGCGIHKIDLSSVWDSDDDVAVPPHTLPGKRSEWPLLPPAFFRLESHPRLPGYMTAAFGTKIISMAPKLLTDTYRPFVRSSTAAILDVHTREMTMAPESKVNMFFPIYFPLADALYVLYSEGFQALFPPMPDSTPEGFWSVLPKPPFWCEHVTSYGVYPDKKTIFVSVARDHSGVPGIYTFNTAKPSQWLPHQKDDHSELPFMGQVHFDSRLQSLVGLSQNPGNICFCDPMFNVTAEVSKEGLFCNEADECEVGTILVHMVDTSKFCLVQCICVDQDSEGCEPAASGFDTTECLTIVICIPWPHPWRSGCEDCST
ncbi:hypothetical protein QOZ80_3BG0276820 [Eleusine coracana subsp. coracana]|nr:hypothetical protein QOZ80_3BG0276820 [Eleusine coracana subsp. coracana]